MTQRTPTIPAVNDRRRTVVVIKDGTVVLAGGGNPVRYEYIPAGFMEDPPFMVDQVIATLAGEGVLILGTTPGSGGYAEADRRGRIRAFRDALAIRGHGTTPLGEDTGWLTTGPAEQPLHIGILDALAQRPRLFDPYAPALTIGGRLARFHELLGVPYRATPGVVGCALVRDWHTRAAAVRQGIRAQAHRSDAVVDQPFWRWDDIDGNLTNAGAGELRWQRDPTPDELVEQPTGQPMYVHHFDVRGQYLAALSAVDLAYSPLRPTGANPWEPSAAGYWQVRLLGAAPRLPMPIVKTDPNGLAWLTAPAMHTLNDWRIPFQVLDSYTCARTSRLMRQPAERIRDALSKVGEDKAMRATIKATYAELVGMIGRPGGSIYRRDWHHHIIDHARRLMLLKIQRVYRERRLWPLRVDVDSVWYATPWRTPGEDLLTFLGVGGLVGNFRHVGTAPLSEYLTQHPRREPRS